MPFYKLYRFPYLTVNLFDFDVRPRSSFVFALYFDVAKLHNVKIPCCKLTHYKMENNSLFFMFLYKTKKHL